MLRSTLRLVANALRLPFFPLWWLARLRAPRTRWLRVRLRARLAEAPPRLPGWVRFVPRLARRMPTSLPALRRLVDRATADPTLEGVAFEVPRLEAGWAAVGAVRRSVERLREAGKEAWVVLPEGGSNRELYLASAADRVLVGRGASFLPLGLAAEVTHLKRALDHLGVRVEVTARGEYKTAAERFVRDSMSEPQREQLEAVVAAHREELEGALGARVADPHALLARGVCDAEDVVASGLADRAAFEDEVADELRARAGGAEPGSAGAYLARSEARFFLRVRTAPYVAVVPLAGLVVEGEGGSGGGASIAFEPFAALFRRLRRDRHAAAVVLLVQSPGGSALTSERLHRELRRLAEVKPVVAFLEDVAASGGYYLAAAADHVVATPTVVTGSIGVVSAKLDASALLGRVGVRPEVVRGHAHADLFSPARALEPAERAALERHVEAAYGRFVAAVAEGRRMPADAVERVARGRVWAGRDALREGLVDALGGLDEAVEAARARVAAGAAARAALRPRVVRPRELGLQRAEPPPPAAAWTGEIADLVRLVGAGARLLAWLPGVPRIG